jgi:hypothetical protein
MHAGLASQTTIHFAGFAGVEEDALASFGAAVGAIQANMLRLKDRLLTARDAAYHGDPAGNVDAWIARVESWAGDMGALYTSLQSDLPIKTDPQGNGIWLGSSGWRTGTVDDWVASTQNYVDTVTATGQDVLRSGASLASDLRADTLSAEFDAYASEFPGALHDSWKAVVSAAKTIVVDTIDLGSAALQAGAQGVVNAGKTLAWGAGTVLLLVGGAAALAFFLLRKSGVKANVGPVKLGALRGQKKRVDGTLLVRGRLHRRKGGRRV